MAKRERSQRVEPPVSAVEKRKRELREQGMSASQAGPQAFREAVNEQAKGGNG